MKLKTFLQIFGGLTIVLTLLRFIAVDYWWVRVFDFPHIQLTILSVIAFAVYFLRFDLKRRNDYIFASLMLACIVFQFVKIYNYTPLATFEIGNATSKKAKGEISLFTSNVLQKNKHKELLITEIENRDADILLLTETNKEWQELISKNISKEYKYSVEVPLPNTYGMLLYSKNELINAQVKYQVDDSIPSIHTKIRLTSGDTIQFYSIHPTPPMPQHNPKSSDRDAEMMKTAKLAMESTIPVLVTGDFNDVAWSQTTALFQRISSLLDPRKGRGLYNTYNARSFIFKWPLDHIFVGPEFRVKSVVRGNDIKSDHYPMYVELSFEPELADEQRLKPPTKEELKHAHEQIEGDAMDAGVY